MYIKYKNLYNKISPTTKDTFIYMMGSSNPEWKNDGCYAVNCYIMGEDSPRIDSINGSLISLTQDIPNIDGKFMDNVEIAIHQYLSRIPQQDDTLCYRFNRLIDHIVDSWSKFDLLLKNIGADNIRRIWKEMKTPHSPLSLDTSVVSDSIPADSYLYTNTWTGRSDKEISAKFKQFLMAHWFVHCYNIFTLIEQEDEKVFGVEEFLVDNELA